MQIYDSFQEINNTYLTEINSFGFLKWTIVWIEKLKEEDRSNLPQELQSKPQLPIFITIADPLHKESRTLCLNTTSPTDADEIATHYMNQLLMDYPNRVKGIAPVKIDGFFEYENWSELKEDWLMHRGNLQIPYNFPLLFDLPGELEFIEWQKRNMLKLPYKRLLVTFYQYKTGKFFDLFVKNADQHDVNHYFQLLEANSKLNGIWKI